MPYELNIMISGVEPIEQPLSDGRLRIGSKPECEIFIDSEEVAAVAAQLDVRGEAVFIRNLNPFPIYVGEYELSSSQQGEWPVGETVLLTQSVSLELLESSSQSVQTDAQTSAQRSRSTMQIAVVILCLGMGFYLLSTDDAAPDSTKSLNYSFTDLVEQLEEDQTRKYVTVLNYLIDARVSDVRWGSEDPKRAVTAYQLLLDEPLIRAAEPGDGSPEARIKRFAFARVDDLSSMLSSGR